MSVPLTVRIRKAFANFVVRLMIKYRDTDIASSVECEYLARKYASRLPVGHPLRLQLGIDPEPAQ